jgi:hypothetical protein
MSDPKKPTASRGFEGLKTLAELQKQGLDDKERQLRKRVLKAIRSEIRVTGAEEERLLERIMEAINR